jgi:hypothetical protein
MVFALAALNERKLTVIKVISIEITIAKMKGQMLKFIR